MYILGAREVGVVEVADAAVAADTTGFWCGCVACFGGLKGIDEICHCSRLDGCMGVEVSLAL